MHHPVEHVDAVLRLHTPDDGAVAVFRRHHAVRLVAALGVAHDLAVDGRELGRAAAVAHVVRVVIQRERRADKLRVGRAVHLEPRQTVARGIVDALGALEVVRPVPVLARVLLDEGDDVADILRGVILHIVLLMAHGRDKLERRDAVFALEALGDDAVAHERAVAGGVALHGADAEHGEVIVDGAAGLGLRHGADVACDAELLRHVEVVRGGVLRQEVCHEHRRHFAQDGLHVREAHHERGHLVFVREHAFFGKFHVVAGAAVAAEDVVHGAGHVVDHEVHGRMDDAQRLVAQAHRELVDHVRHGEVVGHPAVAEHGLDVARLDDELCEEGQNVQPAAVVIEGILDAAPLAPAADLSAVEEYAELLVADAPLAFIGHHHRTPPCIFLISMLSTNAWTRVRIWPIEERMLYGRSTDSTGKPKSSRSITEPSVRSYAHGSQNLIC